MQYMVEIVSVVLVLITFVIMSLFPEYVISVIGYNGYLFICLFITCYVCRSYTKYQQRDRRFRHPIYQLLLNFVNYVRPFFVQQRRRNARPPAVPVQRVPAPLQHIQPAAQQNAQPAPIQHVQPPNNAANHFNIWGLFNGTINICAR